MRCTRSRRPRVFKWTINRGGPLQFVIADVGRELRWISEGECFAVWKSDVRVHVVAPDAAYWRFDDYPGGYCLAVGYVRRSTSKQEKSLADQRREIQRYANEDGYDIVRWCEDDAVSGDATEKRTGFQQMRQDAAGGAFQAVICWDQDRFGRFDSLEAGYWIKPFRDAGVTLVTVNEGPVNWNDFSGRLMYGIKQEGKYQFLRDLSRNTARGQISNAQQGFLSGQAAPYGYDRMLVDEMGVH